MKKLFYLFCLLWSCAYLLPLPARADSTCTADFSYSINAHTVSFKSSPALPPGTIHWWTFGDATNSTETNPVHTYVYPGTYWVTHYIQNQATNCRDSVVRTVVIDTAVCNIQPKFDYRKDTLNPLKIYFINQSIVPSSTAQYLWTFGDGTSSTEVNPVHVYTAPGTYEVCLKVFVNNTCVKQTCKVIVLATQCNLQIDFTWKFDSVQRNKVHFRSIIPPVTTVTMRLKWTFGDGSTSTEPNPVHVYQQPGTYTVCLIVEIGSTCRKEVCKQVVVQGPACNVRAKFEWKRDPSQWNKIWFANLSQPVQNIWRTSWSYGDGTGSQDFNSFHVYQQPGKYYVCLKVQSLNGCIDTYCDSVIVRKPQNCDSVKLRFEYSRDSLKPYIVKFHAISNVPVSLQQWTITKLTPQTFPPSIPVWINGSNPTYTFRDSGWYMVCLYAITSNNCKKAYCEKIYIPRGENGRMVTSTFIPAYPNPARSLVRLEVEVDISTTLRLRVLDAAGVPKMEFSTPARAGNNYVVIPVEKLSSGLYMVEIRYGNQLKMAKFQKS